VEATDVVEPPKQFTARHVAAVFEKMGYDPAAGTKVFAVLLDLLAKARARAMEEESDEEAAYLLQQQACSAPNPTGLQGIAAGQGAGVSSVGGGSSSSGSGLTTMSSYQRQWEEEQRAQEQAQAQGQEHQPRGSEVGKDKERDSFFNTPLYARKPRASSFTASLSSFASTGSSSASARMDVSDFLK
jgi:hypothetical protein